jgi:predicted amidophosphoribosyltransferase
VPSANVLADLLHELAGAVFPGVCPGCGRPAEPVCGPCAAALRPPPPAPPPPAVDAWVAPFAYEGVARELVARAKYRGRHAALQWLAHAVATALGPPPIPVDVVTWVPTDRRRRRDRGFDHARRLATAVARRQGLVARELLVRDPSLAQTELAIDARRVGPPIHARARSPARVLLVDDVATTGASLTRAAVALRAAGALTVIAATAARTP